MMTTNSIVTKNKRILWILFAVAILLLIPLIAMQFTSEVNWTLNDFVAAAALLTGTGILCEVVLRKIKKPKLRVLILFIIGAALLLVWAELAVGLF